MPFTHRGYDVPEEGQKRTSRESCDDILVVFRPVPPTPSRGRGGKDGAARGRMARVGHLRGTLGDSPCVLLQRDISMPRPGLLRCSSRLVGLSAGSKRDAYLFQPLQTDRCSYLCCSLSAAEPGELVASVQGKYFGSLSLRWLSGCLSLILHCSTL